MTPHFFRLVLPLIFLAFGSELCGQVWPGDANDDGRVSNVDLVYLGYAFGQFGPARDSVNNDWSEQRLPVPWPGRFPNTSISFAFADCNGDGLVNILDVLSINRNYRQTQPTVEPEFFIDGFTNIDPGFSFQDSSGFIYKPHLEGVTLSAEVNLGSSSLPIQGLNGVAFTVRYDPEVVDPSSINLFLGQSWLNPSGNQLLRFQNNPEPGILEIGVSNFGQRASSGAGNIGRLFFIIEDDIISFRPNTDSLITSIIIDNIVVVDTAFNEIPVAGDTLEIKVVKPSYFITSTDILPAAYLQLFPNPVANHFVMRSQDLVMESVDIYNTLGKIVFSKKLYKTQAVELSVGQWPRGMYLLRVTTDKGLVVKRLVVE